MNIKDIEAAIEAILFASGGSVDIESIGGALEIDKRDMQEILSNMMLDYNQKNRGLRIIRLDNSYQLTTRTEYYECISRMVRTKKPTNLSGAALEALAIVAYNQPVTRQTVEHIRGVNSDGAINRLLERELVEEKGRLQAPGKPIIYGTTEEFLRCFELPSLNALPYIERFAKPAEEIE